MNKIDEIALRVADKYDPRENYFPYRNDLLLYVKELLAELSKDAEPVEIIWPNYHPEGMGCGLEDRNITDRYEAMQYGWDCAIELCQEVIPENIYEHPAPVIASEQKPVCEGYIRDGK